MAELEYSTDALNARSAFFGAKTVIYVEGDDDILFWREVFARVADEKFEIESVGGSDRLDEYIRIIVSGQLNAIAARDADFLRYLDRCLTDPKVVYTFGYSIENSLYVAEVLACVARSWCKTIGVTESECLQWLSRFAADFAPLVHMDLANAISDAGVPTIGDNCSRFMTSNASASACLTKIESRLAQVAVKIPDIAVNKAKATLGNGTDTILACVRGHFLESAVIKFVASKAKSLGRKATISSDSLYAVALANFGRSLDSSHPHKDHYIRLAAAAWSAI